MGLGCWYTYLYLTLSTQANNPIGAEEAAADMGMVAQGVDLSYTGVCNIWTGDLGSFPRKSVY